jgi:hypothetical protein
MSFANFGENPVIVRGILNASPGNVAIPILALGSAQASINLIQTAAGAAKVLTIGEGFWSLSAQGSIGFVDAVTTCQIMYCVIVDTVTAEIISSCPICAGTNGGADAFGANGITSWSSTKILSVEPGATRNLTVQVRYTGLTGGQATSSAGAGLIAPVIPCYLAASRINPAPASFFLD